jgi:hypothetical protein
MGEWDTLDDDFTPSLTQPVRLSCALTRLVLQLDGEPASKFYLHRTNDNETFIIYLCLPTAAITQIFSGDSESTSLGSVSANTINTTEFILRADGANRTISTKNLLTHVFRRLPALETVVVIGMPLDNVVAPLAVLSDELGAPVLPRIISVYIRGIGAETEAKTETEAVALTLVCCVGQRLEALPEPGFVCPASLKGSLGLSLPIRRRRGH